MEKAVLSYTIGESTMALGNDNIIYFTAIGDMEDEHADQAYAANRDIMDATQGAIHSLADMSKAGKSSPYARKMWKELSSDERSGKVALYGINPVARVLASFFIGTTSRNNIKFFTNREKAMAWIKEKE